MRDVILKGELHSSRGDFEEERQLVKEGLDSLVLEQEDPDERPAYKWYDGWYSMSVILFFWFLETVYLRKEVLEDLAEFQGADVRYTRETNADMLAKAPTGIKALGAIIFYVLLLVSVGLGVASGPRINRLDAVGAMLLFLAVAVPPLIVRIYNMRQSSPENNRDQEMADIIAEEAEKGKVVAVVGSAHLAGIEERFPEELETRIIRPVYGFCTYRSLKEVVPPLFKTGLVLFSFYLLTVWIFSRLIEYYAVFRGLV